MNTLHFSQKIDCPREVVWQRMLDPEGFKQWTAAFAEGSYFEGSWDEGAAIRFLTPDGWGMVSRIAENRPYEFISIMHRGVIKDGTEDLESPEVKAWAPAFENYRFEESEGATTLTVAMDVSSDYEEEMREAWPKALARLKDLCEHP